MSETLPELDRECFVISPIGAEGSQERERADGVLDAVIGRAAEELGLTAVRADQLEQPGQITLQVIEHVLGARAAVADLTGLNPNVFYELAVRHTARLPVALIAEKSCELPFDIVQMRTIFFDSSSLKSSAQCSREIVAHLRRALDKGKVDSPIATSLDVRALASGSVAERNIAEVVTGVERIARVQRDIVNSLDNLARRIDGVFEGDSELLAIIEHVTNSSAGTDPAAVQSADGTGVDGDELSRVLQLIRQRTILSNIRERRQGDRPTMRPAIQQDGSGNEGSG